MEGGYILLLLHTAFLLSLIPTSSLKQLHFGHCMVSVDMYEMRKGFGDIKEMTVSIGGRRLHTCLELQWISCGKLSHRDKSWWINLIAEPFGFLLLQQSQDRHTSIRLLHGSHSLQNTKVPPLSHSVIKLGVGGRRRFCVIWQTFQIFL